MADILGPGGPSMAMKFAIDGPGDQLWWGTTCGVTVHPHVYFHEMYTLHAMRKCAPCKRVTGMQCSILMVPCVIMRVKMKL